MTKQKFTGNQTKKVNPGKSMANMIKVLLQKKNLLHIKKLKFEYCSLKTAIFGNRAEKALKRRGKNSIKIGELKIEIVEKQLGGKQH